MIIKVFSILTKISKGHKVNHFFPLIKITAVLACMVICTILHYHAEQKPPVLFEMVTTLPSMNIP